MSTPPTFFWDRDRTGAAISAGVARLRIQAMLGDEFQWTVFDGFRRIGTVSRYESDATPLGEQLLWARLAKMMESIGKDADKWEFRPGSDTL